MDDRNILRLSPRDMEYFNQAIRSIENSDLSNLQNAISKDSQVIRKKNASGQSLLNLACLIVTQDGAIPQKRGTTDQFLAIEIILNAGANPSEPDPTGRSPLHVAAISNHFELAKLLLDTGASLEGKLMGARGGSPLALALFYAKSRMAQFLSNPPTPYNLRTAAALGHEIEPFLEGGNLKPEAANQVDFYRPLPQFPEWVRTCTRQELLDEALSWSARNEKLVSMSKLVKYGANVNSNPYRGTPLLWSIYSDSVYSAKWLIEQGADPNLKHDFGGAEHGQGATAIHLAAQYGSLKCLRLLLEKGADPYLTDNLYNSTALDWAKHEGTESSISVLSEFGVVDK